jgi:hypothetical protein
MKDEEAHALRMRAAAELLGRPGVHGVALGSREKAGAPTGELALRVYVTRKKPEAELAPGEALPKTYESLPVDVAEHPVFVRQAKPGGNRADYFGSGFVTKDDAERTPLVGGIAIQGEIAAQGTLGLILESSSDRNAGYGLSNHHVLLDLAATGQSAHHPDEASSLSFCCSNKIGSIVSSRMDVTNDAACVRLSPGVKWKPDILDLGPVRGRRDVSVAEAQTRTVQVVKRGIISRVTGGVVIEIGAFTILDSGGPTVMPSVMVIEPNPASDDPAAASIFSAEGDSGAAVLTEGDNKLVGLLFGGPPELPVGDPVPLRGKSVAIPIGTVLDGFANHPDATKRVVLAVPNVQAAGEVRTVPGASRVMHSGEVRAAALRAESALGRSALGTRCLALYRRHGRELTALVRENRKVQAEWHRSGSAELLQAAMRTVLDPEAALPEQLSNGLRIAAARALPLYLEAAH